MVARFLITLMVILPSVKAMAMVGEKNTGAVFVFGIQQRQVQANALTMESVRRVNQAVKKLGRFLPEDGNRVQEAMERIVDRDVMKRFQQVAQNLELDLYMVVNTFRRGEVFYGDLKVVPLSSRYAHLSGTFRVRSRVSINIPVKLARKVLDLHKKVPVHFRVLERVGHNTYRINAGQWHGLARDSYPLYDGLRVTVTRLFRYESIVTTVKPLTGDEGSIITYPQTRRLDRELFNELNQNTIYRYSNVHLMKKGSDPEKKFFDSFFINVGSNIFLPIYGTFLTTGYLGLQQKKPSVVGIVLSSTLLVSHILVPEIMGKFDMPFWPWEQWGNKTKSLQNLQIFLWASIPLIYTVGYLDQLAFQYSEFGHLPPFFEKKNLVALAMSTLFPGGGWFYKGHRIPGWGFYLGEMSLLGYAIYSLEEPYVNYIWIALGALKALDLVLAAVMPTGYRFFNRELNRSEMPEFIPDVRLGMWEKKELITGILAVKRF